MFFKKKKEEITPVEKKYEIVSLGTYCISRTVLTRQNLKPKKVQGELSCPFDLVIHNPKRITHYIKTDFDGYFDDLYFKKYSKCFLDFRNKGIWKKEDDTWFFHDKDCKKDDKDKLIKRVSSRIENFRKIMQNEKPIIFVQALKEEEDIDNLYSVLRDIRGNKPFKLVIIDLKDVVKKEYSDISILKIPFPTLRYEKYWDRKKYYNSKQGIAFEKHFTEMVETEIKNFMQN
ncbi:hypothetical protein IJD44_08215 [bacterium]|nr:hypothetical protein [bacterium]